MLKKHVSIIHSTSAMTALQRKLLNALLFNAYDQLLCADEHAISLSELSALVGFNSKNTRHLKQALV